LVLNKLDLLPEDQREKACSELIKSLGWKGSVYKVSAINSKGLDVLCRDIMTWIDAKNEAESLDQDLAEQEQVLKQKMQQEARVNLQAYKEAQKAAKKASKEDDDEDDYYDDDDEAEVYYAP
jgi:GTP-binding protein